MYNNDVLPRVPRHEVNKKKRKKREFLKQPARLPLAYDDIPRQKPVLREPTRFPGHGKDRPRQEREFREPTRFLRDDRPRPERPRRFPWDDRPSETWLQLTDFRCPVHGCRGK